MKEKNLEIHYDHYKDTFSYLRTYIADRDKVFYVTLIIVVLIFFQSENPDLTSQITINLAKKQLGEEVSIDLNFVNSVLLFLFFSLIIKYFQLNLLIGRQYSYLHKIEEQITDSLNFEICREGKAYVENYPLVSRIIHRIYTIAFPIIIIIVATNKWLNEFYYFEGKHSNAFFLFDSVISWSIIGLTIVYLIWVHFEDFKNFNFFKKRREKGKK